MSDSKETYSMDLLKNFLENEKNNESEKKYDKLRIAGYVMDISFDKVRITTNDAYKRTVGGIPKNSNLIMIPEDYEKFPPHFTVLRVLEAAVTPLTKEVEQTYFELHKRAMPELDAFTANELQWGALNTEVLGMFYQNPDNEKELEFAGDMNNIDSPHRYRVYSPDQKILDLITNSLVPQENKFNIGELRLTENRLRIPGKEPPNVPVQISPIDFMGTRTAMFGKTRLGKSNIVKVIAQSIIETTSKSDDVKVGQLIFDIDGEYANDNPQDGSKSLKSAYDDVCYAYSFNPRDNTFRSLKLNFYEYPNRSINLFADFIEERRRGTDYVRNFYSAEIPPIEDLDPMAPNERRRASRIILMYWAVLKKAGFEAEEERLARKVNFNPGFRQDLRDAIYDHPPPQIDSLDGLVTEFEHLQDFIRNNPDSPLLNSTGSGNSLFDVDEKALLKFLQPGGVMSGTKIITPYRMFHDKNAGDTNNEIIDLLEKGKTVILDLSNAQPTLLDYYSEDLSSAVFQNQVEKFTKNELKSDFIQLYFEEAHNIFPKEEKNTIDVYRRIAKEGAKYHIGMVYSTQSVSSINKDLLAQTENFFVTHLSSQDEVSLLSRVNSSFKNLEQDILKARTVGYVKMLTRSHRFVIPCMIKKFEAEPGAV